MSDKHDRHMAIDGLKDEVKQTLLAKYGEERYAQVAADVSAAYGALKKSTMRMAVIETNVRMDGRALDAVRQISIEVGVLPRAHAQAKGRARQGQCCARG